MIIKSSLGSKAYKGSKPTELSRRTCIQALNISILDENIKLFRETILRWFQENGRHYLPWRRPGLTSYQIIIAEILLQRTKAETVEKNYASFIDSYGDWAALVAADIVDLERQVKPMGLYRQRASRLKALAVEMNNRNGIFPGERESLEQLPCLGQYIVNAIELQIFSRRRPLIDVNMSRVLERCFGERKLADIRYDPYLQALASAVVNHRQSKEVSWAILDFAASVCKAREPLCEVCVLKDTCRFTKKRLP